MMRKKSKYLQNIGKLYILLFCTVLISCGSNQKAVFASRTHTKKPSRTDQRSKTYKKPANPQILNIVDYANSFKGTRYKFGGTTKRGMDCSGLVYTAYLKEDIQLPRRSRDMAKKGVRLRLNQVNIGDLLFFKTGKNKSTINHVGLVVDIMPGQVRFIHATSSRGVLVSSLNEAYWNTSFVEARRIL